MPLRVRNVSSNYNVIDAAETRSELKVKKRPREQFSNKENKAKRAKLSEEVDPYADHSLLHVFVEYAWEASYGKFSSESTMQLVHWLFENIKFGYTPESMDIRKNKDQSTPAKVAHTLRFLLPILMKCNGDVNYTDEYGQTILHVFLKHYTWNPQPRLGTTDLKLNKLVAALLSKGASVNLADEFGKTPFGIAAASLRRDLCRGMLSRFENVGARDEKGDTALHTIAGNRSLPKVWREIVRELLSKGAEPDRRNKEGLTAVHLAAEAGKDEILRIFAENGADFSLRTPKDETSLVLYCRNGENELLVDTVELLLTEDCDVSVPDEFGYSPIHYATRHGADAVVDRLGRFQAEKTRYSMDVSVTMLSASFTTDEESFPEFLNVQAHEFSG